MIYRYFLFKSRLPLYHQALNTYVLRQSAIARNIANITTPRYRPIRVSFEEELQKVKELIPGIRTNALHFPVGSSSAGTILPEHEQRPVPRPEIFFSGDAHVNIDKEMAELAETQIRFRLVARLSQRYFQGLSTVIRGTVR